MDRGEFPLRHAASSQSIEAGLNEIREQRLRNVNMSRTSSNAGLRAKSAMDLRDIGKSSSSSLHRLHDTDGPRDSRKSIPLNDSRSVASTPRLTSASKHRLLALKKEEIIMPVQKPKSTEHSKSLSILWKKSSALDLRSSELRQAVAFLPKTERIHFVLGQIDFEDTKTTLKELSSFIPDSNTPVSIETISNYLEKCGDLTLTHLQAMDKAVAQTFESRIHEILPKHPDTTHIGFIPAIFLWNLEAYMEVFKSLSTKIKNAVQGLEKLEEENLLFRDLVSQHPMYGSNPSAKSIEISVKQVLHIPTNSSPKRMRDKMTQSHGHLDWIGRKKATSTFGMQTEIDGAGNLGTAKTRSSTNLLRQDSETSMVSSDSVSDKAADEQIQFKSMVAPTEANEKCCGSDRPIPTFKSISIFADMPHPIEAAHKQLQNKFEQLKKQKEAETEDYESQLASLKRKMEMSQSAMESSLTDQIDALKKDKDSLTKRIQKLENEKEDLIKVKSKQMTEVNDVKDQMQRFKAEAENAKRAFSSLHQENESYKTKVASVQEEIKMLTTIIDKKTEEVTKLDEAVRLAKEDALQKKKYGESVALKVYDLETKLSTALDKQKSSVDTAAALKKKNDELVFEHKEITRKAEEESFMKRTMESRCEELEETIDQLMKFPDESLGCSLKDLDPSETISSEMEKMIQHNNVRISLLEARNERYRQLILGQVAKDGRPEYLLYHPLSEKKPLFDKSAVTPQNQDQESAPTQQESPTTYIIGSLNQSRAASASTLRFIQPHKKDMNAISRPLTRPGTGMSTSTTARQSSRPVSRTSSGPVRPRSSMSKESDEYVDYMSNYMLDSRYPPRELKHFLNPDMLQRSTFLDGNMRPFSAGTGGSDREIADDRPRTAGTREDIRSVSGILGRKMTSALSKSGRSSIMKSRPNSSKGLSVRWAADHESSIAA